MNITEPLTFSIENEASDLHLSSGLPPMIRGDGDLRPIDLPPLRHPIVQALVQRSSWRSISPSKSRAFLHALASNAFHQQRGAAAVFHVIPLRVLTLDELGAPKVFEEIIDVPRGLVSVTDPTDSGKSTTLATRIDYLNHRHSAHILTIEDPIEFVHSSRKCIINQREVHKGTLGFSAALR